MPATVTTSRRTPLGALLPGAVRCLGRVIGRPPATERPNRAPSNVNGGAEATGTSGARRAQSGRGRERSGGGAAAGGATATAEAAGASAVARSGRGSGAAAGFLRCGQ